MRRILPKTVIKTLLHLEEPEAEIVIHADNCYLLAGKKALYIPNKVFDALLSASWITHPQAVGEEHANCFITPEGQKKAKTIYETCKYRQLPFLEIVGTFVEEGEPSEEIL